MSESIKDILLRVGVSAQDFEKARQKSTADKTSFMSAVESLKLLPEEKILECFSLFYKTEVVHLETVDIMDSILKTIPKETAHDFRIIPIEKAGNNLIVASSDPKNAAIVDALRKLGYTARVLLASDNRISQSLEKLYGKKALFNLTSFSEESSAGKKNSGVGVRTDISAKGGDKSPVMSLVDTLLIKCLELKASDIHFESYEKTLRVRFRIDGALHEVGQLPVSMKDPLVSRIKIMAGLNIAERRLPQDGSIRVEIANKPIDFRVNSLPCMHGEKVVMRILDKSSLEVDMTKLGFEDDDLVKFIEAIERPEGMVLVTGPTGSGKTTTLYSALAKLNKISDNIMTAEDPVEFNLEGINQVQVKPDIGFTFAEALRSFLRQDPDVIMVGEIRDLETCEIAVKASLTGHMVLSTLHTNSAADTIIRLQNIGIESYNLVAALNAIIAQRLVRRICTECRVIDDSIPKELLLQIGIPQNYISKVNAYKGAGCQACNFTGMRGRVAIHEVMVISDALKSGIMRQASSMELKLLGMQGGMRSLRQAALSKLVKGLVPVSEVVQNTSPDKI